jgi:hypothetical protein
MKMLHVVLSGLLLAPVPAALAQPHDFDAVVSAVEQRYDSHADRVPMMGFVSFCAWVATAGGVKGMKVAEFDHLNRVTDPGDLERVVSQTLGSEWERFVTERNRNGELSLIFAKPHGANMRMLIASYEHGELDVVRLEVNGDRLRHWIHDPEGSARRHAYSGDETGVPD